MDRLTPSTWRVLQANQPSMPTKACLRILENLLSLLDLPPTSLPSLVRLASPSRTRPALCLELRSSICRITTQASLASTSLLANLSNKSSCRFLRGWKYKIVIVKAHGFWQRRKMYDNIPLRNTWSWFKFQSWETSSVVYLPEQLLVLIISRYRTIGISIALPP